MFKNFGATTDPDTIDKSGIYYFTAGTIHAPEILNRQIGFARLPPLTGNPATIISGLKLHLIVYIRTGKKL